MLVSHVQQSTTEHDTILEFAWLKKNANLLSHGQVDFPVGQVRVTQHSQLPEGQGPTQVVCQLNKKVGSYVLKASAMLINDI